MNLQEALLFVARFEKGDYTPEEYAAFLDWLEGASVDDLGAIADAHEALMENHVTDAGPSAQWVAQLESKLDRAESRIMEAPVRPIGLVRGRTWAVAASILVLFAGGAYWWFTQQSGIRSQAGSNKNVNEVLSNIVSAPRGQQKELVLPDGSKVWLNAASTLRYPLSFKGRERSVELSGEAFFEVAKNTTMPFKVKFRDITVEVLGTQFNVMDYPDEPISQTTILEGMVKIARGTDEHILQPDDQAEIAYPGSGEYVKMKVTRGVDPESVIAWKKGLLEFDDADIYMVKRAISRAYNVDIQYNGKSRGYTGNFSKEQSIDQVLEILRSQKVDFRITK